MVEAEDKVAVAVLAADKVAEADLEAIAVGLAQAVIVFALPVAIKCPSSRPFRVIRSNVPNAEP